MLQVDALADLVETPLCAHVLSLLGYMLSCDTWVPVYHNLIHIPHHALLLRSQMKTAVHKEHYLGGQALRQVPQGYGHGPEPVNVQEAFGACS